MMAAVSAGDLGRIENLLNNGEHINAVDAQAKTALMAALSSPYLHPKLAVAVDDDIDANDLRQVMWSMTTRVHAERDIVMIPNTRVFALDNISPVVPGQNSFHRIGTKWMTKGEPAS